MSRRALPLLLVSTALLALLAFGTTRTDHALVLQIALACVLGLWVFTRTFTVTAAVWVVLAIAALLLYVTPLPPALLARVAPLSAELNENVAAATGLAPLDAVSIDVGRTVSMLPWWGLLALVIVLVARTSRSLRARRVFVAGIAAAAAVTILLGALAPTDSSRVLWFYEMPHAPTSGWRSPLLSPYHSAAFGLPKLRRLEDVAYTEDWYCFSDPIGSMVNENQFSAMLGITLPMLLALLLAWGGRDPRRRRLALGIAVVVAGAAAGLVTVVATSKGGTIALAASLVAFVVASRVRRPRRPVRWLAALGTAGLVVSIVAAHLLPWSVLTSRIQPWRAAIETFQASPLVGAGPGSFASLRIASNHGDAHGDAYITYLTHNEYLQLLSETGLLGILLVGLAVAPFLRMPVRRSVRTRTPYLFAGAFAGIVFALVHGTIDYGVQIPATALMLAIQIGLLAGMSGRRRRASSGPATTGVARAVVLVGLAAVAWCSVDALGRIPAETALRRATSDLTAIRFDQRPEAPPAPADTLAEGRAAVERAIAPAARSCGGTRGADCARHIGFAWLLVSDGLPGQAREEAKRWLSQSLRLQPGNRLVSEAVDSLR